MAVSEKKRLIKVLLFIIYIAALIYMLFLSDDRYVMESYKYNLEPFKEIKRFITYRHVVGESAFIINILGNIIAFMPFGFLYPQIIKKRTGFFSTAWGCFLLTLFVETMQLLLKVGRFDIDDIILNTCGGIAGYLVYLIYRKVRRKI